MKNLPPIWRHLILITTSGLIGWGATDGVSWLNGQTGWGLAVGGLVAAVLAYLTPLVRAYGVGKAPEAETFVYPPADPRSGM